VPLDTERTVHRTIQNDWAHLEPWVDRLTFKRQDGKGAFMDPAQRFPLNEALQRLHAQCKLAQGE
jgi:hypothetical protein